MTRLPTLTTLAAFLFSGAVISNIIGSEITPGILPRHANPYGKSYREWAAEWEKFLFSIPLEQNPVFSPTATGSEFAINHCSPVSLLVEGIGPGGYTVNVPAGRAIFFPLVWGIRGTCPEDPTFRPAPGQSLEEFLLAQIGTDSVVTALSAEVDGVSIKNVFQYRAHSGVFTFDFEPSFEGFVAPCGTGAGEHQDLVDGYWLMLAPLSKGQHTLHWAGTFGPPFDFSWEHVLRINVD